MSDLLVFLARARRLDPHALARLQPVEGGGRAWAVLPFGVLATRVVPVAVSEDVTVRVSDLFDRARGAGGLASVEGLSRHDGQWRGGTLPDPAAPVIERMAAHECRRIGDEAGTALRAAQEQARVDQRAVGERKLRDTLLDHVALTVTAEATRYEIPVRLVVGLLRMAFAGDGPVLVRRSGRRLGLEGVHGGVWLIGGGLPLLT
ncbi:MAG TPA: hypothetical protein H9881_03535 [Candidatus Stackebrandtia excrementipullorum]|nr:hypothetical protein [Candidatus Stackebrandtia excrementipullorum]